MVVALNAPDPVMALSAPYARGFCTHQIRTDRHESEHLLAEGSMTQAIDDINSVELVGGGM